MNGEDIRKQREVLAAAEPFADLEQAALLMYQYVDRASDDAAAIKADILAGIRTNPNGLREAILRHHAEAVRTLNEAVDRVMRTSLMDAPPTEPKPEGEEP